MNRGLCPKCQEPVDRVETESVAIGIAPAQQEHGISYICPSCKTVLGIHFEAVSVMDQALEQ